MSETYFEFIPQPPQWRIDWSSLETEGYPWIQRLQATQQDSTWHGEGDVWTHTKMVCEALTELPEWRCLDESAREIVFVAALMHDIGKSECTKMENGRIVSPKHAFIGGQLARKILSQGFNMTGHVEQIKTRETIVAMIRYHSLPCRFLDRPDPLQEVIRTSCNLVNEHLAMLSQADLLGRISEHKEFENIALFRELTEENHCWNGVFPFNSPHDRYAYFSGTLTHPMENLYDDSWGEVVMLSGLPASGKDYYATTNLANLPMISLDELRKLMKVSWQDDQGTVVYAAKEKAKEYLRTKQSFVWNATNLTTQIRGSLIRLFTSYKARVKIIYLETPWTTLLKRNSERADPVNELAIEKMFDKFEMPTIAEAHELEIVAK